MLRFALVALLALFATAANAQNCVTATCTLVMDWSPAPAPNNGIATQCRLREGAAILETRAIGAFGSSACTFTARNFTAGAHTVSGTVLDASGTESAAVSLTFTSVAPPGPPAAPTNLRFQ